MRITGRARYDRRPVGAAEIVAIAAAGMAAGAINTLVGSGTLITFPVLLAFGYSPVTANVSNNVGLVPGSVAGAIGYRRELRASAPARSGSRSPPLSAPPPARSCSWCCPPRPSRRSSRCSSPSRWSPSCFSRGWTGSWRAAVRRPTRTALASRGSRVYVAGVYGGYFGAAQGILLLAILGLALPDNLQRVNALKNVLAGVVNGVAAVIFILVADIAWGPAALIAAGSVVGAQLAARYGRRMSARALRAVIVAVGIAAIVQLVT